MEGPAPRGAGCWVQGACAEALRGASLAHAAADPSGGPWLLDPVTARLASGRPRADARVCLARARELWALCGSDEWSPVSAWFPSTGALASYPPDHAALTEEVEKWDQEQAVSVLGEPLR